MAVPTILSNTGCGNHRMDGNQIIPLHCSVNLNKLLKILIAARCSQVAY
jgi:hypothetical protein